MINFAGETWVGEFTQYLVQLRESNPLYRSIYEGKLIGALAIADNVDTGYSLAYRSGCEHRMSKHNRAWLLVHGSLQATAGRIGSSEQSAPINITTAKHELEPWYLGCSPRPLFDKWESVTYPDPALFVYPENFLVPKQQVSFVSLALRRSDIQTLILITKNPVFLTDLHQEAILVINR